MADETKLSAERWQVIIAAIGTVVATLLGTSTMTTPLGQRQNEIVHEVRSISEDNKRLNERTLEIIESRSEMFRQIQLRLDALEKKVAPK